MVTGRELTETEKECLAKQIRQFLLDNNLWQDVNIYFNGKEFSTSDDEDNFYYNDPGHLIVLENKNPRDYFQFVASNSSKILSSNSTPKRLPFPRQWQKSPSKLILKI